MSDTICWPYPAVSADETVHTGEKVYHLILLLGCAAVIAASFMLQPGEEGLSLFGLSWPFHCWLHETLGVNCALCGMSRSFCWLAHGDLNASLAFHRLGPFLFSFFCLQIPYRLHALAVQPRRVHPGLVKVHLGLVMLLCAAIACNWFVYLEGLIV